MSPPVWHPSDERIERSTIVAFARWLGHEGLAEFADPTDYHELQAWTAARPAEFWPAVATFFSVHFTQEASQALVDAEMPEARWFPGATLNLVHHIESHSSERTAVISIREDGTATHTTYEALLRQARSLASYLTDLGIGPSDRVVGYLPNCTEGVVAFLAAARIGACWSQTGMDFSADAAADRLAQLEPKVLITGNGYQFRGVFRDRRSEARRLSELLPTAQHVIAVETAGSEAVQSQATDWEVTPWAVALAGESSSQVTHVPFEHPLWVLFTSGTTGAPKGVVHGHGGILLEQFVLTGLHLDLKRDDIFFWYTTPNWMMWNVQVCSLLLGATAVFYEGDPAFPSQGRLWEIVGQHGVTVFGTSPAYLQACAKAGVLPSETWRLTALKTLGVTGSVLPAESNGWVRSHVGAEVQVASVSGGTDVAGAFVSSAPNLPVWDGEISAPALGVSLEAWNDSGESVIDTVGELVVTRPMPSMPLCFWGDDDKVRYRESYFSTFERVWRQGDWITVTDRGSIVMHGRSDATLNRRGVRLGTSEIYRVVEEMPEVVEALVVGVEQPHGDYWMPMFVVAGDSWTQETPQAIKAAIVRATSPRHVPDDIYVTPALPHTKTGKKLEVPIKRILAGEDAELVLSMDALDDPDVMAWFLEFARLRRLGVSPQPSG